MKKFIEVVSLEIEKEQLGEIIYAVRKSLTVKGRYESYSDIDKQAGLLTKLKRAETGKAQFVRLYE